MKIKIILAAVLPMVIMLSPCNNAQKSSQTRSTAPGKPLLEEVFSDSTFQLTGVAIAGDGRLFTNYPYWLDEHQYSVVEVRKGQAVPYPDSTWNSFKKGDNGDNKFVCVQSVVTDDKGYLWVVDAAGIALGEVYQKSSKILKINLTTDRVERIYRLPESVARKNGYLNDIRIDNKSGFAYLTSSSEGGIIVLNIKTGDSRFLLGRSPSVKSDPGYKFSPLGRELLKGDGSPLKVNSDGIALNDDRTYLYFKPLTDNKLYRIKTELLRDFKITEEKLSQSVEKVGAFVTTDGMIFDKKGNLYFGDLEKNSIVRISPDLQMETLVRDDERLRWPDSYSISGDGYLYISCSQIQYMPWFHKDQNKTAYPYHIYRLKI